jgi:hypothetical protein
MNKTSTCTSCKITVSFNSSHDKSKLYFCSNFCLNKYKEKNDFYDSIHEYFVSTKSCKQCSKKIKENCITYFFQDEIYCSFVCRDNFISCHL